MRCGARSSVITSAKASPLACANRMIGQQWIGAAEAKENAGHNPRDPVAAKRQAIEEAIDHPRVSIAAHSASVRRTNMLARL
jgi:hypothetical protein